uniref:Uncharacterized protein n=1 Tax=Cucumis sativus TaxID=3659 RepID=A0A0A0LQ37_CUCSA
MKTAVTGRKITGEGERGESYQMAFQRLARGLAMTANSITRRDEFGYFGPLVSASFYFDDLDSFVITWIHD